MSRYGTSTYGTSFYGEPLVSLYSAEPFEAKATFYGTVLLEWRSPGGGWDELRLVRNPQGYPVSVENGTTVYTADSGTDLATYRDEGLLTDRWIYYSIFVHDALYDEWIHSGSARAYVPAYFGAATRLVELLPDSVKSDALARYLGIPAYQYDVLRNDANSLLDLYNADRVNYDLVPVLMEQFGIPAEVELEPEQYRRFLRNAVHLYKTKGTAPCVHGVVSAVTGWASRSGTGDNLLWDSDLSDFAGSVGTWGRLADNASVEWVPATTDPYLGEIPPALRITASTDGEVRVGIATEADLHTLGISVVPGDDYSMGGWIQGSDINGTAAWLSFRWYDLTGNMLSEDDGGTVATRQFVDVAMSITATAPTNAVRMLPVIHIGVATTDEATAASYWDVRTLMLNHGSTLLPHQSGRDIRIVLSADRVNEISNGSFEVDLTGWSASGNVTLSRDTSLATDGAASMRLEYTGADITAAAGDYAVFAFATQPGTRYGFQAEMAGVSDDISLTFLATSDLLTRDPLEDADSTPATVTKDASGAVAYGALRPSFAFVADDTTTYLVIEVASAVSGAVAAVDAVLVEKSTAGTSADWADRSSDVVKPYFDGGSFSLTGDYYWEGTAYASRSHYYSRRIIHESRLREILPRYLPLGATFTLIFAAPDSLTFTDDGVVPGADPVPVAPVGRNLTLAWRQNFLNAALLTLRWDTQMSAAFFFSAFANEKVDVVQRAARGVSVYVNEVADPVQRRTSGTAYADET